MSKYTIFWKINSTETIGHIMGHGQEFCLSLKEAQDTVESLNKSHPEMHHWFAQGTGEVLWISEVDAQKLNQT